MGPQDPIAIAASLASVHHDGSRRYVVPLGGADADHLRIGDEVRLRVRAGLEVPIERIVLRTVPDGEQAFDEMVEVIAGPACRWWETTLRLAMPTTNYRFLLVVAGGHRWLNGSGLHHVSPTDANDFRLLAGYEAPRWLTDRVFYQIFPDRFANGDPTNDVESGAWTYRGEPSMRRTWDEVPTTGRGALVEFYGGDLAGIVDHLDHIESLGANALYLTPIFETRSNHGYDTVDYEHVAAHFGGDPALAALRDATAVRDIRLVLDIAPNHVGVEHPWFQGAAADPNIATAEYFIFHRHPDEYESWLGHDALPKLDYRSPSLRNAIYAAPGSVMRRWLRPPFSIDGWRIDVANMLGRMGPDQLGAEVAGGIRTAVKEESPNAYLVGENAYEATDQLAGDQWNGVMNYAGFMVPVVHWLSGIEYSSHGRGPVLREGPTPTSSLVEVLTAFRAAIPWVVARQQLNLVDSHDTSRIRTVVGGDQGRLRAGLGLLLTYVGVPSILYGDEIGLEGLGDIAARRTMPWDADRWDGELLTFTRALVRGRRESGALQTGGYQVLDVSGDSLAFLRDAEDEWVVVVVNRGPGDRPASPLPVRHGAIPDGTAFTELLSGAARTVDRGSLNLPAMSPGVAVWMARPV